MFSTTHVIMILLCCITGVLIIIPFIKAPEKTSRCIKRIAAIVPFILMILRWGYVIACKGDLLYELPLHLCSMTGILCLIFEFTSGKGSFMNSLLGQALYALCLPGACLAILFPDGTYYPALHFISIQSYLFHTLIIIYMILIIIDGSVRPDIREAYKSVLFLLIVVPPVMLFDHHFGTNYMFLNRPSNGSPLARFYDAGGYGGYLAAYAVTAIAVICLMNLLMRKG
ncbi:MAG: TIGR02206 family membrane protein [Lachnospiraceae bacterium]|nr:TIGR02206 family membrane protein [Lachnospiraceae bacterium]